MISQTQVSMIFSDTYFILKSLYHYIIYGLWETGIRLFDQDNYL